MGKYSEEARERRSFRERLLLVLLRIIAAASLIALVPSAWLSIKERLWVVLGADLAANLWVLALAFIPGISYRVKVLSLVILSYLLGVLLILETGPYGAGHLYIFAFVFFVALFGTKTSILLANLLALLTHAAFALAKASGLLPWEQGLDSLLVISSNFVLVSLMLSYSAHYLISSYSRAAAEERRMRSELEILLHEIEHRVKNNIQVVSSIVNLKSRSGADPARVVEDIKASLAAIAAVHQLLYRREGRRRVGIRALVEELFLRYRNLHRDIEWRLLWEGEEAYIDGDRAVDLGLLVNELVMNSLKHAFPESSGGSIFAEFRHETGRARLNLRLGDEGGASEPVERAGGRDGGKGLKIIEAIARHLQAKMELEEGPSWVYRLSFPVEGQVSRGGRPESAGPPGSARLPASSGPS